ncbi:Oidioi.mRNA.OKI2018_I69.PAR.g11512.t1.cds [Oikopleura dioica]|uniref:Oidioi.mRNA.OKI2018_I69.PAR.g11512.t1.cds n=1 Tax=Oikopleura dioica TaxID=34765 RepID=A0ABN7RYY8_OIKDI|nr:Oidioi.mRNA.OKI2018_I69.PAR.g11512.t1.cds [Oikopleura dioica]
MFGLLVVLFSFLCGIFEKTRLIWFATLLGPFGALLRHFFGKQFNGWRGYPLGTFLANILGSIIYSILFVVIRRNTNLTEEVNSFDHLKWTLGGVLTGMNSLITRNAAQQFSFQKVLRYQKFKLKDWKFTREAEKRLDKFRFLVYGFTLGISCLYAALHQPQINALPVLWKLWREEGISPKNIATEFLLTSRCPSIFPILSDEQPAAGDAVLVEKMMNKRHRYEPNKMLLSSFREPKSVLRVLGTEGDTVRIQGCKIEIRKEHLWLGTDDTDFRPFYTNQRLGFMWFYERIKETMEFYTKGSNLYRNRNLRTSREFGQIHQSCVRKIAGFYDPVEEKVLSYEEVLHYLNLRMHNLGEDNPKDEIQEFFPFKPFILPESEKIHLNSGADIPGTDEKHFKNQFSSLSENSPVYYKKIYK